MPVFFQGFGLFVFPNFWWVCVCCLVTVSVCVSLSRWKSYCVWVCVCLWERMLAAQQKRNFATRHEQEVKWDVVKEGERETWMRLLEEVHQGMTEIQGEWTGLWYFCGACLREVMWHVYTHTHTHTHLLSYLNEHVAQTSVDLILSQL